MTSKSAFCLFPTNRGVTGLFPCRKPWRSWRSFVVLATTLMEEFACSPFGCQRGGFYRKVRAGWKGIRGPICPQFSSKRMHNITFSQANMHELKDSLAMELSNFPRQWGLTGRRFLAIPWMHLHRRSSQRQEPCAPKVPGREDICRCQLV